MPVINDLKTSMIKQLAIYILCFIIFTLLFIFVNQRRMIYSPTQAQLQRAHFGADDFDEIKLNTTDGHQLMAWYKKAKDNYPTMVYFHGNAGHIGYRVPRVREYINQGYGVLLVEYRGYANNPGQPTEMGLYQDARAAMFFLQHKGVGTHQIILFGESLGTAVATQMATEFDVCALILQAPFLSLPIVAKHHYPWIMMSTWDKYDTAYKIRKINTPLLILHGKKDDVVPFSHGKQLYESARMPKKLHAYPLAHHSDITQQQNFYNHVLVFMATHCKRPTLP